jgi:hypothetical protein
MAASKSNESKVAYIFKESDPAGNGVWYPITGIASTSANYTWTGTHTFNDNPVTFEEVVKAQGGVNNFETETARDAAIPSPDHGTVAFVKTVNGVSNANQIQYYSTATNTWVNYADASFVAKTSDYTIALADSGKTLTVSSSSTVTLTIPANSTVPFAIGTAIDIVGLGSGTVAIAGANGVTVNSKNSWLKLNSRYSGATIMKIDTNTWVLIGDLKS